MQSGKTFSYFFLPVFLLFLGNEVALGNPAPMGRISFNAEAQAYTAELAGIDPSSGSSFRLAFRFEKMGQVRVNGTLFSTWIPERESNSLRQITCAFPYEAVRVTQGRAVSETRSEFEIVLRKPTIPESFGTGKLALLLRGGKICPSASSAAKWNYEFYTIVSENPVVFPDSPAESFSGETGVGLATVR